VNRKITAAMLLALRLEANAWATGEFGGRRVPLRGLWEEL